MTLNKSKGNMYKWVTNTWNPLNGTCEHDCSYCYVKTGPAKGWKHDVKIMNAIKDKLGEAKTIFVCTQTDLFGKWVDEVLINMVLGRCNDFPLNTYLFQSKNPARFMEFENKFPQNTILCTTIETNRDTSNISKAPKIIERFTSMAYMQIMDFKISVTIEPIMDFDYNKLVPALLELNPDWVSIGADSKHCNLPEPSKEKVMKLIEALNMNGIKIEQKRNLTRIIGRI